MNHCLGLRLYTAKEMEISFSDVYAIEPKEWGSIYDPSVPGTFLHGDCVEVLFFFFSPQCQFHVVLFYSTVRNQKYLLNLPMHNRNLDIILL